MSNAKFSIVFHTKAKIDYEDAYHWYEIQEVGLGERFLIQLWQKIDQIINNPEIYASRSNKHYREARLNDFPYTIVYKIQTNKKAIFISAIHHQSKNPRKKYRKLD